MRKSFDAALTAGTLITTTGEKFVDICSDTCWQIVPENAFS
jgi:hypothetical protein